MRLRLVMPPQHLVQMHKVFFSVCVTATRLSLTPNLSTKPVKGGGWMGKKQDLILTELD